MLERIRSARSRKSFLCGCVAYLLLSMFADFLHVHPLASPGVPTIGSVRTVVSTPTQAARRHPGSGCAICQWQRLAPGEKTDASTSVTLAAAAPILPAPADIPERPVPHPTAFRGPPALSFS